MNRDEKNDCPALVYKAKEAAEKYGMLDCRSVIVGVSGGADSMALLHFLCSQREGTGLRVYAAHVNHGLRGEEALRDENFVLRWCEENNVELFVLHADVKKIAKEKGRTVEEAGRGVRYQFFENKAEELSANIATAHTLSDSMETQIFNLARGTGLRGLCGIPPVRGKIIRPLITCTRRDTEEYCQNYGIKYLDDSTNFSRDYTRNRIRLDLIPKLYEINPAFDRAEERLFASLEEDEACLEELAAKRLKNSEADSGKYSLAALTRNCSPAVLKRCAAIAAAKFTGISQEYGHINAIACIAKSGTGKAEIKGGFFVQAEHGLLIFSNSYSENNKMENFEFPFQEGTYSNIKFSVDIVPIPMDNEKNLKNINKRCFKDAIDCDKIKDNAIIRARIQGDTFSPAGRNITKTLKKLFNEAKVPVEERAFVPVAADSEGIFWVAGFGTAERCKITEETHSAVLLEIKRLEV